MDSRRNTSTPVGHLRAADSVGPDVRLSRSPARSPHITEPFRSAAGALHPEMTLTSMHALSDSSIRTADFFDDGSSDDDFGIMDSENGHADILGWKRRSTLSSKRRSAPTSEPLASRCEDRPVSGNPSPPPASMDGYQRLAARGPQERLPLRFAETPRTSYNGSVDELLPDESNSLTPSAPESAHFASGRSVSRNSGPSQHRSAVQRMPLPSNKDQIIAAHQIAHEITLQALMRDDIGLGDDFGGFAPLDNDQAPRSSALPSALRPHDPRSPRKPSVQAPESTGSGKKVHIVPPPIDTSAPRRSLPQEMVRTPYPLTADKSNKRDFEQGQGPASRIEPGPPESVLTLSIRRTNPNAMRRVISLTIPPFNGYSAVGSRGGEEKSHYKTMDFDDAELFNQLRASYRKLTGSSRCFSARSLRRITVGGPASTAAEAGYGRLHQPRSQRALAYQDLPDSISDESLLQHYLNPSLGRRRYAFVGWAHRLAAAPPSRSSESGDESDEPEFRDLVRRMEQPQGLEFVVGWSIKRIAWSLLLLIVLSVATAVLWILLGKNTVSGKPRGGFRDAGDRVLPGVVMSICLLLIGLSGFGGWLGVSWLVM